jgi:hypothetical protein
MSAAQGDQVVLMEQAQADASAQSNGKPFERGADGFSSLPYLGPHATRFESVEENKKDQKNSCTHFGFR